MARLSGSKLAELTGHSWRTVQKRLQVAGVAPVGRERNADLFDSRAALAREQRAKLERQRMQDEGRLLDKEAVAAEVGDYISVCCLRLHQAPGRVAAELDHDTGRQVEPLVRRVIFEAIEELSRYEPGRANEARGEA